MWKLKSGKDADGGVQRHQYVEEGIGGQGTQDGAVPEQQNSQKGNSLSSQNLASLFLDLGQIVPCVVLVGSLLHLANAFLEVLLYRLPSIDQTPAAIADAAV